MKQRNLIDHGNQKSVVAAIAIALLSALFFASTFVFNSAASNEGGYWAWTAALRYLITLPIMLLIMPFFGGARPVWQAILAHPKQWLLWSTIGFVVFYLCLSFAAASGPSWLIAGTFQVTIVAGMLCAPFLYSDKRAKIPKWALAAGSLVLGGVLMMQFAHADGKLEPEGLIAMAVVILGAFAFPLGNRGLLLHLEKTGSELNATQRVFGMTLASQPMWLAVAVFSFGHAGVPSAEQVLLAGGVAIFAGIIATILFFKATGLVRNNPSALAATEAMQATEVVFATIGGALWIGEVWPSTQSLCGMAVVIAGLILFSVLARRATGIQASPAAASA